MAQRQHDGIEVVIEDFGEDIDALSESDYTVARRIAQRVIEQQPVSVWQLLEQRAEAGQGRGEFSDDLSPEERYFAEAAIDGHDDQVRRENERIASEIAEDEP